MPFHLIHGDITKLAVDAIVNAATTACWEAEAWTGPSIGQPVRSS